MEPLHCGREVSRGVCLAKHDLRRGPATERELSFCSLFLSRSRLSGVGESELRERKREREREKKKIERQGGEPLFHGFRRRERKRETPSLLLTYRSELRQFFLSLRPDAHEASSRALAATLTKEAKTGFCDARRFGRPRRQRVGNSAGAGVVPRRPPRRSHSCCPSPARRPRRAPCSSHPRIGEWSILKTGFEERGKENW